jgi:hypothetical protein
VTDERPFISFLSVVEFPEPDVKAAVELALYPLLIPSFNPQDCGVLLIPGDTLFHFIALFFSPTDGRSGSQ